MKKRIFALLTAVTMLMSLFTVASASSESGTLVSCYEDFGSNFTVVSTFANGDGTNQSITSPDSDFT